MVRMGAMTGGHRVNHVACGAGRNHGFHFKGAVAVAANNLQRSGDRRSVKSHHAHLVRYLFAVVETSAASVVHRFTLFSGVVVEARASRPSPGETIAGNLAPIH